MKTETQIAEEKANRIFYVKDAFHKLNNTNPKDRKLDFLSKISGILFLQQRLEAEAKEHKSSCQRDVLKLKKIKESIVYVENELAHHLLDEIIEDKEQAIKLYDDAGLK